MSPSVARETPEPHAARSAAVFVSFSLLQRALGFGRMLLLLWLLDPVAGEYGLLLLSLYLLLLLAPVVTAGVPWSMDRFVARFEAEGRLVGLLRSTLALIVITTAAACGLLGALAGPLAPHLFAAGRTLTRSAAAGGGRGLEPLVMILAADLFVTAVFYFAHGVLRGLRRVAAAGWMETVQNVLFTGGVVAALLLVERSARCALAVHAISQLPALVVAALAIHAAKERGRGSFSSRITLSGKRLRVQHEKRPPSPFFPLLRYSVWVGLAEFAWPLLAFVPLWVATAVLGGGAGDVLAGQVRLTGVLTLVGLAISGAVGPHLAADWESGRREVALRDWAWWTKLTFCGLTLAAAVAWAVAPWLLRIIPDRFREAALFRDMLLYAALAGGYLMLIWRLRLAERTLWLWLSPLIAAVSITALCAWWVPAYGIRAAAVARWVGLGIGCLPIVGLVLVDLAAERPASPLLVLSPALLYTPLWIALPVAAALVAILVWTGLLSPRPRMKSGR